MSNFLSYFCAALYGSYFYVVNKAARGVEGKHLHPSTLCAFFNFQLDKFNKVVFSVFETNRRQTFFPFLAVDEFHNFLYILRFSSWNHREKIRRSLKKFSALFRLMNIKSKWNYKRSWQITTNKSQLNVLPKIIRGFVT